MLYKTNRPNLCSSFQKRSLKKVKTDFRVGFEHFLRVTFSLVELTHFCD